MTIYKEFEHSIASTKNFIEMYRELRRYRGLGPRGRLPPGHEDLLWLPRSAVVAAIASLDAYVHSVLYDQVPHALRLEPIPGTLCEQMAKVVPIKDGKTFRRAFQKMSGRYIHDELAGQFKNEVLAFAAFQTPDKIRVAYAMIGVEDIFGSVSSIWPGPTTSEADIRKLLANYVKRRNQIAHEGDRDATGNIRRIQPQYAMKCATFVENLVSKLNRVVYG